VDRWALSRLQRVIDVCRESYEAFDFRRVFQTLNQFCTVDLSSLYVDITKDRLYCDAANSPRRRATQVVMSRIFDATCRLLAPILAFTADEAWEAAGHADSVHLAVFPKSDPALRDEALEARFERWLELRTVVAQAVEPARQQKLIGNALEADILLSISDPDLLTQSQASLAEVEEVLILSQLRVQSGATTVATLSRNPHARCGRCWRHKPSVGTSLRHPDLCERCESVVNSAVPLPKTQA
jgi:isoleucyl-tRNA synthetase